MTHSDRPPDNSHSANPTGSSVFPTDLKGSFCLEVLVGMGCKGPKRLDPSTKEPGFYDSAAHFREIFLNKNNGLLYSTRKRLSLHFMDEAVKQVPRHSISVAVTLL